MPEMALFVVYVKIFVSIFSTVQVPGIGFFVWSSSKRDLSHRVTSAQELDHKPDKVKDNEESFLYCCVAAHQ